MRAVTLALLLTLFTTVNAAQPAFKPMILKESLLMETDCHQGSCAWAKIKSIKKSGGGQSKSRSADLNFDVVLRFGLSEADESGNGGSLKWNKDSETMHVRCSTTKPSVTGSNGKIDLAPDDLDDLPMAYHSELNIYRLACFSVVNK
jgi:hypothetical protein